MRYITIAFLLLSSFLFAQTNPKTTTFYEIRLAIQSTPTAEPFKGIRKFAYPYPKEDIEKGGHFVVLGPYGSESFAKTRFEQVKKKGFPKAIMQKIVLDDTDLVYSVQMYSYKETDMIDWAKWGKITDELQIETSNDKVRVLSGVFENRLMAEKELARIKNRGITDAFLKRIYKSNVHTLTSFEQEQSLPEKVAIDPKLVMALQQKMKEAGYYAGAADGIFNEATKKAVDDFKAKSLRYHAASSLSQVPDSIIQNYDELTIAISSIHDSPKEVFESLQNNITPHSLAYQAYMLLHGLVESSEKERNATELMSAAFALATKNSIGGTKYDYTKKYYFSNVMDWLEHLPDLQVLTNNAISVPCWIFEKHPSEVKNAFTGAKGVEVSNLCGGFLDIPELKTLQALSLGLAAHDDLATSQLDAEAKSALTTLFISPQHLPDEEAVLMEQWHKDLTQNINAFAKAGKAESASATPFLIAYHETLIRLQFLFAEQGFLNHQTLPLSLKVLHALLGKNLQAYTVK